MSVTSQRLVFVVLLHYPMVDRNGKEVTTAVTNLDIHDIARSCKTYGITQYFIVNPEPTQRELVSAILTHWEEELVELFHPSRAQALKLVKFVSTFEEAYNEALFEANGQKPFVVMPDAKDLPGAWSYQELRKRLEAQKLSDDDTGDRPLMIVFGTGWGISPSFYKQVDCPLKALRGVASYNHLSVRAAAAIVLDRLFSKNFENVRGESDESGSW